MSDRVPFRPFLHANEDAASRALGAIGAVLDPRLTIQVEVGGRPIQRWFGRVGNLVRVPPLDGVIADQVRPLLQSPENDDLRERLESGKLDALPVNKRVVRRLTDELHARKLHLPWTFKPMNLDFAAAVSRVHKASRLPYAVYYNQQIQYDAPTDTVAFARVFSLPVGGMGGNTWEEPILDEILDPDVALLIEANTL